MCSNHMGTSKKRQEEEESSSGEHKEVCHEEWPSLVKFWPPGAAQKNPVQNTVEGLVQSQSYVLHFTPHHCLEAT